MRVTAVECDLYRVPAPIVLQDSIQRITHWEWVIATVHTDAAVTGTGFSYTLGMGGAAIRELVKTYLAPMVIGRDPADVKHIWERCWRELHANGSGGFTTLAIAPLDIALHDILAKSADVSLYELLGQGVNRIPAYASGLNLHLDGVHLLEQIRRYLDQGYRSVKVKVGREAVEEDVDRVASVRELIGPDLELLLDANQAWTVDEAIDRGQRLERFRPTWLEEPCLADDILANAQARRALSIPIAVGETLFTKYEFTNYIRAGAVDIVQADIARVGGFTAWTEIAELAHANGLAVAPHFLMELSVHGLCSVPNGRILENVEGGSLYELGIAQEPVRIERGIAYPPNAPGHGIVLDQAGLARYLVTGPLTDVALTRT
jgi:L-alanine-DL-glutamate epimerase-like enolase superfamily enzyme